MAALTNQSRKALRRIPLIAPNSVHFCPISEPNHLQYQKIRVGIRSPGASNQCRREKNGEREGKRSARKRESENRSRERNKM